MGEFIWEKLNWLQVLQLNCKKGVGGNGNTGRGFYGLDGPKDSLSVTLLPSQVLQPCVTLNRGTGEKKIQNPPFL